jgi:cytochrome bd-type quinol oxidase subunit 1
MADAKISVQDALRNKLPKLDSGEIKTISFWIAQVFIIVSTIIGVYLAAQSGLTQALKFDAYGKMHKAASRAYASKHAAIKLEQGLAKIEQVLPLLQTSSNKPLRPQA